ncbi:MAG: hypothetical protein WA979_08105 [Pacificimonas sp.]
MIRITLTGTLLLAACATTGDSARAPDPDAVPYIEAAATGEPQSCLIRSSDIRSTEGLSRQFMLFRMRGGDLYRAEFNNSCPGSARDEAFSRTSTIGSFCKHEILNFFDPVSNAPLGSCTIKEFVPIEDPKKTDG